ncbi:MAG: LemA family protein [Candidatus Saccharibacteria bacterium]|nr:LemA family protein [Candidatus Saccharibacteria bacterium]
MKKKGIAALGIIGIIAAIGIVLIGFYVGTYNSIIGLEQNVEEKASTIKTQLQRRADLIPNLVSTVKGYTKHEQSVIDSITDAREAINGANSIKELSDANNKLNTALNNLNVVIENYPDLKADTTFIGLMDELSGSENRISTARTDYNNAVKSYNTKISSIPSSIVAGMMGKQSKEYFEVTDESKLEVPEVNFDDSGSSEK